MAVVARELAGLEARVERELAADCTTWQQLALTKRRLLEPQYNPPTTEGLTRSERLLWFRRNQQELELDNERAAASTNYRQLQLARGVRAVQETEEERAGRAQTRSEARLWYRQGGEAALEAESATAALCSNWQQFHLMTRGRGEEREEGQLATPSERLHWYRQGGRHLVEARDNLARESGNWMQYKINRDKNEFSDSLEDNIHTKWSKFESKEELKDYLAQQRTETMQERNAVRAMVAGKINKETVTKNAYEISKHSFDVEEIEEESRRRVAASLGAAERVAALRAVTEEMLTKQTEYSQSGRQLALQAYREQDQAVAASRSKKTTTVVSSASVAA